MRVGDFLLNEKTKVSLNIVNFLLLFGFIITVVFTWATWTADMEAEDKRQATEDKRLESLIVAEKEERKLSDVELASDIKEIGLVVAEIQAGNVDLKEDIARLETHMLWMIDYVKKEGKE